MKFVVDVFSTVGYIVAPFGKVRFAVAVLTTMSSVVVMLHIVFCVMFGVAG